MSRDPSNPDQDTYGRFDRMAPRERFGDGSPTREAKSDLVDLPMFLHLDRPASWLVSVDGDRTKAVWIPRSQAELVTTGPRDQKKRGFTVQPVTVTMPAWLAAEKGLS